MINLQRYIFPFLSKILIINHKGVTKNVLPVDKILGICIICMETIYTVYKTGISRKN